MGKAFLATFAQFVHTVTGAARGMAVDAELKAVALLDIDEADLQNDDFNTLAAEVMAQAMKDGEAIITNNMITDPDMAPVTNTNFTDLRIIVAMPVGDLGAIYIDQPVRSGVISNEQVNSLIAFAQQLVADEQFEFSVDELVEQYNV